MFGRQWSDAETVAQRWRSLDPDDPEAPQILGQALLQQEKSDSAASVYKDLLAPADTRPDMFRNIQFELQRADNPSLAVSVMQSLSTEFPDDVEAHLGLARALVTNNQTDAALEASVAALEVDPESTDALLLQAQILSGTGKPEKAIALLQRALEQSAQNTDLRLGYAQLLAESGRYELVDSELDIVFGESENDPDTLLTISLIAMESLHLEQASTYLRSLLDTGEYPDQANFYLARIDDEQKEYEQAIAFYDAVLDGELQFEAQLRAAELTALIGNLDEGRKRLQTLASTVNPLLERRVITSESRMLQNANLNAEAVDVLDEGLKRYPDDEDLLYARALASHSAGDDENMIGDLDKLISLDPNNAHALNALGYHFAEQNTEIERAEQLLVKANELMPDDPAIMDSLGWLRFRQGRYEEAIALLRKAYARFPDPEIAAHLVQALWLQGEEGEARQLMQTALQTDPDDENLLDVQKNVIK
jgi:tetratricopeptide (TPR) repeat protein